MKFEIQLNPADFLKFASDTQDQIARAASAAMADGAAKIKSDGKRAIAAAGLGPALKNGLRTSVRPRKPSLHPEIFVSHRIGYASIFETGGTIRGKPLLWLPIEANLPSRGPRFHWTPKRYISQIGRLASANHGGRPLLVTVPPHGSRRRPVPVFVGVDSVDIRKRFDIETIIQKVVNEIPALFEKHLND